MAQAPPLRVVAARTPAQIEEVRALFREYAAWLGSSRCFQDFDMELATLPGQYAAPHGRLLVALDGSEAVGCVAMRPLGEGVCEMKRLYVRPSHQGRGAGRRLVGEIIAAGRSAGHRRMRLDTIPSRMGAAVAMYRRLGFVEIAPYAENPVPDALFMELALRRERQRGARD